MTTPAAPQGAPTTPPAAPATPPVATPPAATPPVPTPPPSGAPATPPAGQQGGEKTFTQTDVERILKDRMDRFEKSVAEKQTDAMKKLAEVMGWQDPAAAKDPAELLKQAQQETGAVRNVAVAAVAEALALRAGIKPERIETFVAIAEKANLFKDVDLTDASARAALQAAVEKKAGEFPEWKGATLPGASGGDGQGGANPSLDERIATAEKANDWKTAITLKRQKAREQKGG